MTRGADCVGIGVGKTAARTAGADQKNVQPAAIRTRNKLRDRNATTGDTLAGTRRRSGSSDDTDEKFAREMTSTGTDLRRDCPIFVTFLALTTDPLEERELRMGLP